MHIHLRAPDPNRFTSGGNLYNLQLAKACRDLDCFVVVHSEAKGEKTVDITLWDSICLPSLLELDPSSMHGIHALLLHSDTALFRQNVHTLRQRGVAFISPGRYLYDEFLQLGIPDEECLLLEPGGDRAFPPSEASLHPPVTFALVANLTRDKGVAQFLLDWQANLLPASDALKIHLFGDANIDPVHAREILDGCQRPGWKQIITYHGILPQRQLFAVLSRCHGLLSVSPAETYGMAIREARQAGLPVLALNGGNIPHLIQNGRDGKLYPNLRELILDMTMKARHPGEFLKWLQSFTPEPIEVYSWQEQAEKLTLWLRERMK